MTVAVYPGYTEYAYRLMFSYEDDFSHAPFLQTIRPDGTVETEKVLNPKSEKAIITYPYAQSISFELCSKHLNSPCIHTLSDGSYLVIQAWPTNFNEKFKKFYCSI